MHVCVCVFVVAVSRKLMEKRCTISEHFLVN